MAERLALPPDMIERVEKRASVRGTAPLDELFDSGLVEESRFCEALAAEYEIGFQPQLSPDRLAADERRLGELLRSDDPATFVKLDEADRPPVVLVSLRRFDPLTLARFLAPARTGPRGRLRLVPPTILRAALVARCRPGAIRNAVHGLFDRFPSMSARVTANAWQGCLFGSLAVLLAVGVLLAFAATLLAAHVVLSFFFLACVSLRLAAAFPAAVPEFAPLARPSGELPRYSVLVPLHREAAVVPELLVALGELEWPRERLEIIIVCEEDDETTLSALEAQTLRPWIEVLKTPAIGPRTKPKALSYALSHCSGSIVAIYDAEDRPHRYQLMEAWQAFSESGEDVACLQAPLCIPNIERTLIGRAFGFEYAALFRGVLPWLADRDLFLPLGGTSCHFRGLM